MLNWEKTILTASIINPYLKPIKSIVGYGNHTLKMADIIFRKLSMIIGKGCASRITSIQ